MTNDLQSPSPPRRRLRRGEGALLRDQVLDAADRLLARGADHSDLSMRALATEVGVSAPAIYRHFADKAELLYAMCERAFRDLETVMRDANEQVEDPLEALKNCGRAYVRFGLEHPTHYRMMFMNRDPAHTPPDDLTEMIGFTYVVELTNRAIETGVISESDPAMTSMLLWATVHGIVALRLSEPDIPWPPLDDQIEHAVRVLGQGLAV